MATHRTQQTVQQVAQSPRQSRSDGDLTRTRILDAAGTLFAGQGFARTTSKSIAQAAGADLASINYHFGSRDGLYQTVLAEGHRRLIQVEVLQAIANLPCPAADKLSRLLQQMVGVAGGHQDWPARVLAREILSPTSDARVLLEAEIRPKMAVVQGILAEVSGIPVGDPALLLCMVSVAAPCLMLLVAGPALPTAVQGFATTPAQVLVGHLHAFALAGLRAAGDRYRASAGGKASAGVRQPASRRKPVSSARR